MSSRWVVGRFRAFSCETFDNGRAFLRADYWLSAPRRRTKAPHTERQDAGVVGDPSLPRRYLGALHCADASRAAAFSTGSRQRSQRSALVHRDFDPAYRVGRLEAWKKLFFVGFAVLILPGTIQQVMLAFVFSLVYMLLLPSRRPSRDVGDDHFAKACGFALTSMFFFCVALKVGVLPRRSTVYSPTSCARTLQL